MKLSRTTIPHTQLTAATSDEIVYIGDRGRKIRERLGTQRTVILTKHIGDWGFIRIVSNIDSNAFFENFHIPRQSAVSANTFEGIGAPGRIHFAPPVLALSASSFAVSNNRQNETQWNLQCNAG